MGKLWSVWVSGANGGYWLPDPLKPKTLFVALDQNTAFLLALALQSTTENYSVRLIGSIYHGDCRKILPGLEPADAIVTDPPYGLSFMGKGWDRGIPGVEFWRVIIDAVKPGAHLLAFGGTRTFHRLMCAIEDAGFEIRDCLMWVYGSGFPKSLDVSKAIDKAAGAEREVVGEGINFAAKNRHAKTHDGALTATYIGAPPGPNITAPATEQAKQWEGWGTALKPAWEPIILARKPLVGTVAENVQRYGTGALNIDACRVPGIDPANAKRLGKDYTSAQTNFGGGRVNQIKAAVVGGSLAGRWPANVMHDGSDEVLALFPETNGHSAARFFYCPKVSKSERRENNTHPTVKPITLLRYLCRLITPPGGVVLDPFIGSGSTLLAAHSEGMIGMGIELEKQYYEIALQRIQHI